MIMLYLGGGGGDIGKKFVNKYIRCNTLVVGYKL
jgi:hypothetical protein